MVDLAGIAPNLRLNEEGIWCSIDSSTISYPSEGNEDCFAIEDASFWFTHRNACITEVVRRFPPSGTIFDIGGGNGVVANALRRGGFDVALLEPGMEGARNARVRGIETVICSTLEDAGFLRGSLPAAGLFDVLEHIEDDEGFLRSLHAYLMPGGRIYLAVPAYNLLWSAEDDYAGHYRRYTLKRLDRVFRAAGFTGEFSTYFFQPLPLPIFLLRTIPSLLRLYRVSAENTQSEHAGGGSAGAVLDRLLARERQQLARGRSIPFGGSCLVAYRKN